MCIIFFSGSRSISRLNLQIRERISNILKKDLILLSEMLMEQIKLFKNFYQRKNMEKLVFTFRAKNIEII